MTMGVVPLACGTQIVPQGGTTGGEGEGTTGTDASSSSSPTSSPSTSSGTTDGSGSTAADETSGGDSSSEGGGESTFGSTGPTDPTSSSGEQSSSSSGPGTLCEQWAQSSACYGYDENYLEQLCYYELDNEACPAEALALVTCEAAMFGAVCNGACDAEEDTLDACELMAEAEELGCYDLPVLVPDGTIEAQCIALSELALSCDEMGYYIGGFSMYADYADPIGNMTDFCVSGLYSTWSPDPETSCGAAFEDLLACLNLLACTELEDAVYPFGGTCDDEQVAVECKCELGIG
jgi:hypothetical protein